MDPYLILLGAFVVIPGIFTILFPSFRGRRWDPRRAPKQGLVSLHGRRTGDRVILRGGAGLLVPSATDS